MFRRFLILAVLLAGCSAQEAAPSPSSAPPTSSSTVSVPDRWNQLALRAQSAYVSKVAFEPETPWKEDYPSGPGGYEHGRPEVSEVCGDTKISAGFKVTRTRQWRGEYTALLQHVHALSEQKATDLVAEIRSRSKTCSTYVETEGRPALTVTPDLVVPRLAGLDDSYAVCEATPDAGQHIDYCSAYLARGDLLVTVGTSAVSDDPGYARYLAWQQLLKIAPVAAQVLAAA
ncbi:hypothetical protein LFM09_15630 [Lentzea alba]|uniref:hypothetical protein n=1 Tax=Lentzea alba TaxID=2714351 RepID=UPI0039BF02B0